MGIIMYTSCGGSSGGFSSDPNKKPLPCRNLTARSKSYKIELTWTDPEDNVIEDGDTITTVKWGSTRIVKKVGSAPESPDDGTMILTSTVRNQYKETPFIDENLTLGTTYYYKAYSCSIDGVYNLDESPVASASPSVHKVMTVVIDLNDSNPKTCGHYEDDAIGMNSGTEANEDWREFFEYKPCILKDGKVTRYLNPNDYNYDTDGNSVDITSGATGDVMVEFPRRGIKISKYGKVLTVSMTDDPDNPEFTYYAHTRGENRRDYFYVGAYGSCYLDDDETKGIYSLSGHPPTFGQDIQYGNYLREYLKENRIDGYDLMTFYQLVYIQAMYCLQYCGKLNYNEEVGVGCYREGSGSYTTPDNGFCDTKGLTFGSKNPSDVTKLFGLEALTPHKLGCFIEGLFIDTDLNIYTATDNFNDNANGYLKQGRLDQENDGFISDVHGTSELGFLPLEFTGSATTYFCDEGGVYARKSASYISCPYLCSTNKDLSHGIFALNFEYTYVYVTVSARLSYY